MVLTKVEASMMLIWLVGRRMEVEVALKVPVYLNSCRRNQILSMRLPFFNISPNIVHIETIVTGTPSFAKSTILLPLINGLFRSKSNPVVMQDLSHGVKKTGS
jgi:hypothetical protein